jgi:hypothetical protein
METFGLTHTTIVESVRKVLRRRAGELTDIQSITDVGSEESRPKNYPKPGVVFPLESLVD